MAFGNPLQRAESRREQRLCFLPCSVGMKGESLFIHGDGYGNPILPIFHGLPPCKDLYYITPFMLHDREDKGNTFQGGFAFGHALGVRVDGPPARRFLRFLSLTGPSAPRVVVAASPQFYSAAFQAAPFHRFAVSPRPAGKVLAPATKGGKLPRA